MEDLDALHDVERPPFGIVPRAQVGDVKLALRDRPLEKRDRPLGDVEADIRAGRIAVAIEAREVPLAAAGVEDRPAAIAGQGDRGDGAAQRLTLAGVDAIAEP